MGGSTDTKLLEVIVFDEATKKSKYAIQTAEAEKKSVSNCSFCTIRHDANKTKIWKLAEMDADHITSGVKAEQPTQITAKYYVNRTTELKEINN